MPAETSHSSGFHLLEGHILGDLQNLMLFLPPPQGTNSTGEGFGLSWDTPTQYFLTGIFSKPESEQLRTGVETSFPMIN